MANPKFRTSKSKKRKRRTHWKLRAPNVSKCSHCGAPKVAHHVCPECGHYGQRMVVAPRDEV